VFKDIQHIHLQLVQLYLRNSCCIIPENMMESNKEEAFRAMEIASKKMENKDFIGAQKVVLKAQKLFPELDNVSQLLTICKVHCAAEARVNGVMDWYGILQVEAGADEGNIKKQYRKLAFSLHPDKNSFAGAEEAFKLIAEAYSVLCDPERRSQHDNKRRSASRSVAKFRKQPESEATFWTVCPHCKMRYQYYSYILNSTVRCMRCKRNFFAHQLKEYHVPTSSNVPNGSRPTNMFPNQKSDTSSQQGHPEQPSSPGGGTYVKPNGHQIPAKMFPNQQPDTSSQHGYPVQPSSADGDKSNSPQVHANMFPSQQHGTSNEHGDPMKISSAGGGTDTKLRMNVAQLDELMKEYNRPGSAGKANQSEVPRGKFQFSTLNQENSSDPTPDPSGPNIVDRQKIS
jgi:curved DNA-binding protein CbpA